jgi:hypothetical protein
VSKHAVTQSDPRQVERAMARCQARTTPAYEPGRAEPLGKMAVGDSP